MSHDALNPDQALLGARILLVDDQPVNIKLLEKILDAAGYTNVVSTTDSREAASLFQQTPTDLVLLDLNMPHKDGFEVLAEIKALEKNYPPVIVLTALKDVDSRVRALESGARDFISKPFDRVELLSRMHNMLEVRLLHKAVQDQNVILEQRVRERTQELEETRMEIIRRLGRAAEYRDNETGLHIIRMSKFSRTLGRAAGMSEAEAEMLLNASPMHDIGKIGIPDAILLKPGKLDADEWQIMKSHATIGARILSGHASELMQAAREIALTHHEKWDGSGYPRGLRGEEIPLMGRIVALADVFDALTSERPYKQAWPVEAAVDYIRESSGKHFDPQLVEIFMSNLDELLSIRDQYAEPPAAV
ncbi:MAG: two-component system response regulator [Gammaproteobacteria bacterium]